jgi:DNA-binding CsgD family transcriptional regulator
MADDESVRATLMLRSSDARWLFDLIAELRRLGALEAVALQVRAPGDPPRPRHPRFSDTEWRMLLLASRGASRAHIVQAISLAPLTVSTYWQRIYDKLGVNTRAEALAWLQAYIHDATAREAAARLKAFAQEASTLKAIGAIFLPDPAPVSHGDRTRNLQTKEQA